MQIGRCWFDIAQAQLSNQDNDTSWKMPPAEFAVLNTLVEHRDKVLSNEQLLASLPEQARSLASLEAAIKRVRFFLGKSALFIEAVDGQGYILHSKSTRATGFWALRPGKSMSLKQYSLLIAQLVLLLLLIYSLFEPTAKIFFP